MFEHHFFPHAWRVERAQFAMQAPHGAEQIGQTIGGKWLELLKEAIGAEYPREGTGTQIAGSIMSR
jgi:hypothetical protein